MNEQLRIVPDCTHPRTLRVDTSLLRECFAEAAVCADCGAVLWIRHAPPTDNEGAA